MNNVLKQFLLLVVLMALNLTTEAKAGCDSTCVYKLCMCGKDQTPAGVMISHLHHKKEWMLSYRFMNMTMSGLQSGQSSASESDVLVNYLMVPKKMNMNMYMLMGMYGLTNRITLMGMLNYTSNSMEMDMYSSAHNHGGTSTGISGNQHEMKTSGLGDAEFHALIGLVNKSHHQLLFSAGVGLPTGRVDVQGATDAHMYAGERYPYMMQLGSGTFNALPCLNYLYRKEGFVASAQASGVIRLGYNDIGYAFGNSYAANFWASYQWFGFLSTSLRMEGSLTGMIDGYDSKLYYYYEPSANPNNYGGTRANCYAGIKMQGNRGFLKSNALSFEYGIPVYQNLNGVQMTTKHSLTAAWSVLF